MVRPYETTIIVDSHLTTEQIEACIAKHSQLIEKNGGKIKLIDRWGKRRLAYEIAKRQYGFYVYIRFEGEGKLCQELNRAFKLDDAILRFLTVAVPKVALSVEMQPKVQAQGEAEATPESVRSDQGEDVSISIPADEEV
jgi:small subunit ribosomal protein S6